MLLSLITAAPSLAATAEAEPNGTMATATVVPLGTTISGSTLSADFSDTDYYAVDLPKAGRVGLNFKFPAGLGTGSTYTVSIYNANGTNLYSFDLDGSAADGSWLASQGTFLPAGRAYIKIYGYSGDASWGKTYTLNTTLTAGTIELEPNNSTAAATVVPLGTTISGSTLSADFSDTDYYAVDLPKAGRVGLNFKFPAGLGTGSTYTVSIYNANGTNLYSFDLDGSAADGSWLASQGTFLPAGRAYIKIYGYSGDASWGKTYTLNTTLTAGTVELEPNNSTAAATVVPLGTTISGSTLSADFSDTDYYAVDLPKAGRVGLNFKFPAGLGTGSTYTVSIYNANGTNLYSFDLDGSAADGSWLASQGTFLPAGRAYIKIYGYSGDASWGKTYTLNTTLTAGTIELEPNNSTAAATVVPLGTTISGSTLSADFSDTDYYAVDLPKAGRVGLNFKFPAGLGTGSTYTVSIYNANGTNLYSFDLDGSAADGSWLASQQINLPLGRAYIKIYGYSGDASWGKTYTLNMGWIWSATPVPGISGTPQVGRTLTAVTGTWSPTPDVLGYQWFRSGTAITGATGKTYTLVAADLGKTITLKVTGSKAGYPSTTRTSAATTAVTPGTLTAPVPTISGTAKVGSTLTAVTGTWGPSPVTLSYQWKANGVAIVGATAATYKPAAADAGKTLTVTVTGTKTGYTTAAKTSTATAIVAKGSLTAPVPTITGTAKVGSTLTAVPGTWGPAPVTLTYQWKANGVAILGATAATYKVAAADTGKTLTITVTGTKTGYTTTAKTSAATAAVV
ncbi:hypothetical protein [Arthrobacter sp. TE12231]